MERILWHRMSVPYKNFSDDLKNFSANGIFFAEEGDTVLMHKLLPEELLHFYEGVGLIFRKVYLDEVSEGGTLSTQTQQKIQGLEPDFFMFSEYEKQFTERFNLRSSVAYSLYDQYAAKYTFKGICETLGLNTPRYLHRLRGNSVLLRYDLARLFLNKVKRAIVKSNSSVAGFNTRVLDTAEGLSFGVGDVRPKQEVLLTQERFFVEEWHDDVVAAPSIQFFISDNTVSQISLHNQLFDKNKRTYRGCQSCAWLPQQIVTRVEEEGLQIAQEYTKRKYRGHLGLNAIVVQNNDLLWLEANPRRVMSSYPFQIARRIAPEQMYVCYRVLKPHWKKIPPESLLNSLYVHLFNPSTRQGIIPFDLRLNSEGSVFLVFIAKDKEKLFNLIEYVNGI